MLRNNMLYSQYGFEYYSSGKEMRTHDEHREMRYEQQMFEQIQHRKEAQTPIKKQMQVVPALVFQLN